MRNAVTEREITCLSKQGFSDNGEFVQLSWAVRFTPLVSITIIAVGLVTHSPWALWGMTFVALLGMLFPRGMPVDVLWNFAGRVLALPLLPATPTPRRFSYAISAVLLAVSGLCFWLGYPVVGWVTGGLVVAGGFVLAATLFCFGSWIYWNCTTLLKR